MIGETCDGCVYRDPDDDENPCHGPDGPPPPEDAKCYDDYCEQRLAEHMEEQAEYERSVGL